MMLQEGSGKEIIMKLKVCTFNLRLRNKGDGDNFFDNRLPLIVKTLKEELPDIIGFQEMTHEMRKMLTEQLPEYSLVGGGREKNRNGESSCIAFLRTKYVLCDAETRMLSFQPKTPGTIYTGLDQSACPRAFTYALFTEMDGGRPFGVVNVHTDHIGQKTRMLASSAMLTYISERQAETEFPFVMTGDFNALPDSDEIKMIKGCGYINEITDGIGDTFHNFGRAENYGQIDYIFASEEFKCGSVRRIDARDGALYISDHYPVIAELTL